MKSQSTWVALLAVGAVAVGIWLIASQPVNDGGVPAPATAPTTPAPRPVATALDSSVVRGGIGAPRSAAPAPTATSVPAPSEAPLPALGVPLAQVIDDLEARARAGDARAACRLAGELTRCASVPWRRTFTGQANPLVYARGAQPTDEAIESAARMELALEEDERLCKDVSPDRTRAATSFLLQAARAGLPAAQDAFVSGGWMFDHSVVHNADAIAAYAREAESMARALLESPAALRPDQINLLGMAFSGDPSLTLHLAEVVAPDPVLARALLGLAVEVQPPPRPGAPPGPGMTTRIRDELDARLTPAERLAATATMDRLRPRIQPAERVRMSFGRRAVPDPADCAR